jgi:hypothetical protein
MMTSATLWWRALPYDDERITQLQNWPEHETAVWKHVWKPEKDEKNVGEKMAENSILLSTREIQIFVRGNHSSWILTTVSYNDSVVNIYSATIRIFFTGVKNALVWRCNCKFRIRLYQRCKTFQPNYIISKRVQEYFYKCKIFTSVKFLQV